MVDDETRLVIAVAEGNLQREHIEAYFRAISHAMAYRKIFDLTEVIPVLTDDDLRELAAPIRGEPVGPLAIVAPTNESLEKARTYATQTRRLVGIFRDPHSAREWLDSLPER